MIQFDEKSIPQKLIDLDTSSLYPTLTTIKTNIREQLANPLYKDKQNVQKALNTCLLLTHFLLEEKIPFENALNQLRKEEVKISEQEHLYFDLLLLQSNFKANTTSAILHKIDYGKLLKTYLKWHLLYPNLLEIRYEIQLKKIAKLDGKLRPTQYRLLLDLLIDWLYRLPAKEVFINTIENKLNQVKEENIPSWASKRLALSTIKTPLSLVRVAVWDTGVDAKTIRNVSKHLALSYDKKGNPTSNRLMPLKQVSENDWHLYKGFKDLQYAKKSKATSYLLQELSQFKMEDMRRFKATITQLNIYSHGTSVASVVSQGNPEIEIIPIRTTFDADYANLTIFTPERVGKELKMHKDIIAMIERNNIAIVNMSWIHRQKEIEDTLANISTLNKEARSRLAKEMFQKLKDSLYNCIKTCSNTLFIAGAGNDNSIMEESGDIPNSFKLPNILTVGAVNHKGRRTDFTTIGKNVQLYANGSHVNTILPKGYKSKSSGTSIAAPQVANLAATMLSICPTMTPITIKKYLLDNADKMLEEAILVLNPERTIQKTLLLAKS